VLAALSEPVQVAGITAAGLVLAASVPTWLTVRSARRTRKRTESIDEKIGEPNGHGNMVEMLTTILNGQAGQDNRIAHLEGGQHQIRQDVARLAGRVDVLEGVATARPPIT
jgi:hypothetical protein